MRILNITVTICAATLLFCLPLAAQEASKADCPDTVSLTDPQLAKPLEGWNVFVNTLPHRLTRVAFFDGPVEEHATLVPDREARVGKTRTAEWVLQPNPKRQYWLACYYSATSLALSRPLPAGLKECTVTYGSAEVEGMPAIKSLACK